MEELSKYFSRIDGKTKVCATIADPCSHSCSPAMHNPAYEYLGLNFVFVAYRVSPQDLGSALAGMKALGIRGFSVSVPHKVAVMQYLDEIDLVAKKIGAVNTVVNENGRLKGYNTDWIGAMRGLEEITSIAGKKAVVIGAGGAARAVAFGLREYQAKQVVILNRTLSAAEELAANIGGKADSLEEMQTYLADADIIFQTTSIGMEPHAGESLIKTRWLQSHHVVAEAVYNPLETKLIVDAKQAGAAVMLGQRMLLWQGVTQFELYTGVQSAPIEIMEKGLIHQLTEKS